MPSNAPGIAPTPAPVTAPSPAPARVNPAVSAKLAKPEPTWYGSQSVNTEPIPCFQASVNSSDALTFCCVSASFIPSTPLAINSLFPRVLPANTFAAPYVLLIPGNAFLIPLIKSLEVSSSGSISGPAGCTGSGSWDLI